jgi:uncharacterized protein with PQ loop repeat
MQERAKNFNVPTDLADWKAKERKCTDSICCIMFTVCTVMCIYFGIWGYMNGNIDNVLAPVDNYGNICGYDARTGAVDVTEYPYLFIWNLDAAFASPYDMFDYGICVKECPTSA